ncbi:hypothetical protein FIA58_021070 [Flavobacterium jejuense]|uniref:Lipoprotein n=1 Tax=Flavobacterium jejuense TaxID=1544455 RepID=A0ABX0IXL2_9FLAO|nr:hypothetical protein [Flavobacterium jejuense]NHN28173.1 hypothetical protein [Flavobacterium jejuense]
MKFFLLIFICLIFSSCNLNNNTSISGVDFYSKEYESKVNDSIKKMIIELGDTTVYNESYKIASLSFKGDEFYYYSQVMAVKYNYPDAYYNMFINFRYKGIELEKLSIYYLLKAYELGSKKAKNDMKYIFKNKEIPKSDDYFNLKDNTKYIKIPAY